jgi:methylase of polypeptide subunit release factors
MPDVKGLLSRIWSQFHSAGVSNDDQIVEHLAALLMEDYEEPRSVDLQLRKPTERGDLNIDQIKEWLNQAIDATDEALDIKGKKAAFFDRYILFQYQQIRNGYYPTPRHIAQYMRCLVQLKKEHTLVDFACGSGGLLVERIDAEQQPQEIIGVDISPDWAKLAWVNTRLHGETGATILVKDALRALQEELRGRTIACILMNPPFGGSVNAQLARDVVGETTSDSTVVLTALALQALAPDGYAAILVPNGILFSGASGATRIRDLLIGRDKDGNFHSNFDLKAIISLPSDSLKPFSAIPTHILLIQKRKADQETLQQNVTWFFRPTDDGYAENINRRDVSATLPKEPNELTLVDHALQRYSQEQEDDLHLPEDNPLLVLKNITLGNMPPAVLIEAINGGLISQVTHCPGREAIPAFFLLEFTQQADEQGTYYITNTNRPEWDNTNTANGQGIFINVDKECRGPQETLNDTLQCPV